MNCFQILCDGKYRSKHLGVVEYEGGYGSAGNKGLVGVGTLFALGEIDLLCIDVNSLEVHEHF